MSGSIIPNVTTTELVFFVSKISTFSATAPGSDVTICGGSLTFVTVIRKFMTSEPNWLGTLVDGYILQKQSNVSVIV